MFRTFIVRIPQVTNEYVKRGLCLGITVSSRQWPRPAISQVPGREEAVVVSNNGDMIICWHPEPKIPYEHTKAIPADLKVSSNVMMAQYDGSLKKDPLMKPRSWQEEVLKLSSFTQTYKNYWKRPNRKQRMKPKEESDREYL